MNHVGLDGEVPGLYERRGDTPTAPVSSFVYNAVMLLLVDLKFNTLRSPRPAP